MKRENPKNIILILKSGGDFKFSDAYLLTAHINKYWKGVAPVNIYLYTDLVKRNNFV